MKNFIKNSIRISLLIGVLSMALTSCSEWTEYKSLEVKIPTLDSQNPELSAAYLKNLRDYKAGNHKIVFVTVENKIGEPTKQAERLSSMPDSIDYISLHNPTQVDAANMADINAVRVKGTKVIYNIDYDLFDDEWAKLLKADEDAILTEADALVYITKRTNEMLILCDKHNYDGLSFSYAGRSLVSLTAPALEIYSGRQNAFFEPIIAWRQKNKSKVLSFIGSADFLVESPLAMLAQCDYVILPTEMANNSTEITLKANMAIASAKEQFATAKFIAATQTVRPDDKEQIIGYFGSLDVTGKKLRSTDGCALWAGQASSYNRSGILIRNANVDYYDPSCAYRYIRRAIEIMNPSPKN